MTLVGGPAGIGKSRLIAEFCRGIGGGRAPTLIRTECLEFGGVTFWPVRDIVDRLVERSGTTLDATARAALERGAFFQSIERIIRAACARRAVIACIEDLHWADAATLDFLAYLAPRIASDRIAIFATYRDDEIAARPEAADALARLSRAATVERIDVRPLSDDDVRALLASALAEPANLAPRITRNIITRAEGNPYHAEELLKAASESTMRTPRLPETIAAGVLKRFGSMNAADRNILAHAAILGYRFDEELLGTIAGKHKNAIAAALRQARDRRLVVEQPDQRFRFRFCHALTHEAIAAEMLEVQARPLHARVAEMLALGPRSDERVDEIAYHSWKARDAGRAIPANEAAARAAIALFAYDAAAAFYDRALSLATDDETLARVNRKAAEVAMMLGDDAASVEFYDRALALELRGGRFAGAGEIVRHMVSRLVYSGRENEGRAKLAAFLRDYGDRISEVDALLVAGWPMLIELGGGDVRAWRERLRASRASAEATGRDAWALLLLEANAYAALGDVTAWRDAVARLEPYAGVGTPADRANGLLTIAVTATYAGFDRAAATRALAATYDICTTYKLPLRKFATTCEMFLAYLHGDLREAQTHAHVAFPEPEDSNQRCNVAVVGALIGVDLGDAALIELASDHLRARILERACSHSVALTGAGIASRLIQSGRQSEAILVLESAVERLETLLGTQFILPIAALHVESREARERIFHLLGNLDPEDASSHATLAFVRAAFAARDGSPDRHASAREAADRYRALRWPLLEARALELAGEKEDARALYMRCGSLRDVRRLTRSRPDTPEPRSMFEPITLYPREREVALLVAAGLRNGEIAERLNLSVKTVETHLSRIYARLGLRSRAGLATYMAAQAPDGKALRP